MPKITITTDEGFGLVRGVQWFIGVCDAHGVVVPPELVSDFAWLAEKCEEADGDAITAITRAVDALAEHDPELAKELGNQL